MSAKELIVVGGPNGAGKTTFAEQYVKLHKLEFLSADSIAAKITPEDPSSAKIAAGREFLKRLNLAIHADKSLVVESTLSGRSLVHCLREANCKGFSTEILFVYLATEEYCIERVLNEPAKEDMMYRKLTSADDFVVALSIFGICIAHWSIIGL